MKRALVAASSLRQLWPRVTAATSSVYAQHFKIFLLTDRIVVSVWIFSFKEGMPMLTIEYERVRRTSNLGFRRSLGFGLRSSWANSIVSMKLA